MWVTIEVRWGRDALATLYAAEGRPVVLGTEPGSDLVLPEAIFGHEPLRVEGGLPPRVVLPQRAQGFLERADGQRVALSTLLKQGSLLGGLALSLTAGQRLVVEGHEVEIELRPVDPEGLRARKPTRHRAMAGFVVLGLVVHGAALGAAQQADEMERLADPDGENLGYEQAYQRLRLLRDANEAEMERMPTEEGESEPPRLVRVREFLDPMITLLPNFDERPRFEQNMLARCSFPASLHDEMGECFWHRTPNWSWYLYDEPGFPMDEPWGLRMPWHASAAYLPLGLAMPGAVRPPASKAPPLEVVVQAPGFSGPSAEAARVPVAVLRGVVTACYEFLWSKEPSLKPDLVLSFYLDRAGRWDLRSVYGRSTSPSLVRCALDAIPTLRWPPSRLFAGVTVRIKSKESEPQKGKVSVK